MSYDLCFYRLLPGFSIEQAVEENEHRLGEADPGPPRSFQLWQAPDRRRLAEALCRLEPSLEEADDGECIELTSNGEPPYQWMLCDDAATITWPYFLGEDAVRQILAGVLAAAPVLAGMGATLHDPQLDRIVSLPGDDAFIMEAYLRMPRPGSPEYGGGREVFRIVYTSDHASSGPGLETPRRKP